MINQNELIDGTLRFIYVYKRLPYYAEDDIEVEKENKDNKLELRPYRAGKYIKEFFTNQDKYTQYLLDNKIITYETISEIIKIDKSRLEKLLNKKIKTPEIRERRQIEIFFNKDYFPELGKYNENCGTCGKKQCKQLYWVSVISCGKQGKKKKK